MPTKRSKTPRALGPRTLLIELRKAERAHALPDIRAERRAELAVIVQALMWALGHEVMPPVRMALLGVDP